MRRIGTIVVIVVLLLSFSASVAGCTIVDGLSKELVPDQKTSADWSGDLPPEFNLLVDAWKELKKSYVDKNELDATKLSQGAIRGMMQALDDPPSLYVDPDMHQLEMSSLRGRYQGIGAYIGLRDNILTIIAPIAGSPAEEAGLKPGDKILEIDGDSTEGMNTTEAALTIQGVAGTPVTLLVLHDGEQEPVEITIVRREITLTSVISERKDNIGYIRITQFLQKTNQELLEALKSLTEQGEIDGLVLDLRNNPGGLLDTAVDITSQFISQGTVVDVVDSDGVHHPERVRRGGSATKVPMIVLVNEGSASASEVLAGALQDYGRAKLAGTKTYGKGSVQIITNLKDGSALHITIARWYTPNGRLIDGIGLTPDIPSELEGDELVDWAVDQLKNKVAAEKVLVGEKS